MTSTFMHPRGRSCQPEPPAQRIVVLEAEDALAGVVRLAFDLDDHGLAAASAGLTQGTAGEVRAGDALVGAGVADARLPPRHLQRDARRHAAAGRTAVDLPAGEDANVAAG